MPRAAMTAAIVHREIPTVPWTSDERLCEGRPHLPWPLTAGEQKRWAARADRIATRDGAHQR